MARQLTHSLLPGMIEKKWGRAINITGKSEPSNLNAANPSKAAVHAWAKGLSREVDKYGITVNSIQLGRVVSEQDLHNHPEQERREFSERAIPVGRFGEPEELACLAVFLATSRSVLTNRLVNLSTHTFPTRRGNDRRI